MQRLKSVQKQQKMSLEVKKILNNKGQTGNSFATGSNDDILKLIKEKGFTEHHLIDMDGNIVSQETLNEMGRKFASGVYDAISPLREFSDKMEKTAKTIESASVVNNMTQQPINVNMGDIHLHEVQDVDGLSKAIIQQMPGKMLQARVIKTTEVQFCTLCRK